ncbi:uncharacterized protein [Setaria viridis]|uniref:uncharacterized protein isoform X2 n=1 Tax=Setaria viridis TaxID=4556 RepID=UPI003B3BCFF8
MSPVPEESKMKMPVAAMGAADDDEDSRWGLFVDSDMLDSMRSILQDKEGKDPYRHLKDDEFPRLDKLAGKERFGSTELGNEKIFDPLALQSRLTTNFRGLEVCSQFVAMICSHSSQSHQYILCRFPLLYRKQHRELGA